MSPAISTIMGKQGRKLQVTDLFDDAKEELSTSKLRGLSVFDGNVFVGYVTRRCFLHKPSYNVILVDHNEVGQSIKGIEEASVVEIIDHHRLDALKTSLPIFIDAEPLGSTCTIVYQQFLRHNIVPDELTAKILLTYFIYKNRGATEETGVTTFFGIRLSVNIFIIIIKCYFIFHQ